MTRTSTQDGLAAAAVVGISIVLVRQLLNSIDEEEKEICKANHNLNNNNNNNRRKYTWMPWWWPIIAIQRWKSKQQNNNGIDTEQYEHRGACNCRSIQFLVVGARQLNKQNQGINNNNAINSSPSKIRFRCIPISASNFQVVCGENEMRFYYENDNSDNNHDSGGESNQAQVFCSNCGVTVFHANRKTGNLEINVDCFDDKEEPRLIQRRDIREQSSSGLSSITNPSEHQQQYPRSQSSLSSTALEKDNNNNEQVVNKHSIGTLLEDEPFLEGFANLSVAMLGESSSPTNQVQHVRKESVSSSDAPTQPESYSIAESDIDDLSMGSSSLTGALPLYHSALSVASGTAPPSIKTTGLPPLPPTSNRISPSDGSIKTLPLWLGSDRPGGGGRRVRNRSFDMNGGGWSVSSELNDDLEGEGKSTISPTMRDQMKKYLERHENSKQHHY